jgi:cysteine-rich repeat protein
VIRGVHDRVARPRALVVNTTACRSRAAQPASTEPVMPTPHPTRSFVQRLLRLPAEVGWLGLSGLGLASVLLGAACGGDTATPPSKDDAGAPAPAPDACESAEAGVACGENQHCIDHRCVPNYCGDGIAAGQEQCDDGNQLLGDGCTPSCRAAPLSCGDGLLQAPEECDDGNTYEYDDCSTGCTFNRCGNGAEDAFEECDDGNQVNDDDCSITCTENRCGNGRVDVGEECDDGNQVHDDGTWVYAEDGSRNDRDTCSNACVEIRCGNGRVEGALVGGSEECDDSNDVALDGCSNSCVATGCGNGLLEPGEVCETAACVNADGTVCPSHTVTHRCRGDCKAYEAAEDMACKQCRDTKCRDFDGFDAVGLCLGNVEITDPENPDYRSPTDIQLCSDLMTCMRSSGYGYNPLVGPIESFCGSTDVASTCGEASNGLPSADGPCRLEWALATSVCPSPETCTLASIGTSAKLQQILGRASSPNRPSGSAANLALCDAARCAKECGPGVSAK